MLTLPFSLLTFSILVSLFSLLAPIRYTINGAITSMTVASSLINT